LAEFIGTFWLVFGGCGSAVLAAAFPNVGIGLLGVSLAFGLTVLTMAYAIGHISGCHLNPAVSIGLVTAKRFPVSELPAYLIAEVLGGIAGAGVLYLIASGKPGFDIAGGLASNGYAVHSPGGYSLIACFIAEVVLTFFFLMIILGATDARAPKGFAGSPLSEASAEDLRSGTFREEFDLETIEHGVPRLLEAKIRGAHLRHESAQGLRPCAGLFGFRLDSGQERSARGLEILIGD